MRAACLSCGASGACPCDQPTGAVAAIEWSREFAHDVKARLRMDPCRTWARGRADRHDPICDELASGIAATICGHGITIPVDGVPALKP